VHPDRRPGVDRRVESVGEGRLDHRESDGVDPRAIAVSGPGRGAGDERNPAHRVVRGVRVGGPVQGEQGFGERVGDGIPNLRGNLVETGAFGPPDDRPRPRERVGGDSDGDGCGDRDGQHGRETGQPALLVEQQRHGHGAPGEPHREVVAEAVEGVVPAFGGEGDGGRERRVLLGDQGGREVGVRRDVGGRALHAPS
jgi:hypothetical protein